MKPTSPLTRTLLLRTLLLRTLLAIALGSLYNVAAAAEKSPVKSKGSSSQVAPNLFKWTDENGKVHYGDHVPPEYARQERKVLNEQGVEMKTLEAAKTPEQIAEEERLAAERKEQERIAADQASHDRMLLATFSTEDDIVMTRDAVQAAEADGVPCAQQQGWGERRSRLHGCVIL